MQMLDLTSDAVDVFKDTYIWLTAEECAPLGEDLSSSANWRNRQALETSRVLMNLIQNLKNRSGSRIKG